MKYFRYLLSPITIVIGIYFCSLGMYYPSIFLLGYILFIIIGDALFGVDVSEPKYTYPVLLNIMLYINLPLLIILVLIVVSVFGSQNSVYIEVLFSKCLFINLNELKDSYTLLDKICLIEIVSLFIGANGTVVGHELTHRKKNKLDMFIGNWLLALSWDCAFAIEHVYGHHKNVCLSGDPATAKRGENIYMFILRAIIKEQKDAWKIESDHLKRRGYNQFGLNNKMIIGYMRSFSITIVAYLFGGMIGMLFYLLCAFMGKAMLETVNFMEHYGLVREPGKPVFPRHSWNSNSKISSIYLYNLTRHSSHHEKANLKFWELKVYNDAPIMPYGYLSMIYIVLFMPFVYHRIMAKKLIQWDAEYATKKEKRLAAIQNKNSGVSILEKFSL